MSRKLADWGGNIVAFVIVIVVNASANSLPIAGTTTGQVADKYESLFTPAGFSFSIWAAIYLALTAFVIYQALPAQRGNEQLARISNYFKISCAANVLWLLTWHLEWLVPSLMLMLVLLWSLVAIYRALEMVDPDAGTATMWLLQVPFSLYLGWISVATIANASAVQAALYWNDLGFDAVAWTLIKLAITGAIAGIVSLRKNDVVFPLVVAWAAFGIAAGHTGTPAVSGAATTTMLFAVFIALYEALCQYRRT